MIVHVFFFCFHTSYFSISPWGGEGGKGWGHAIPLLLILDFKMGSIICISLVHDFILLFFVFTLLTFLPLPGRAGDMLSPFSDFGFENGLNSFYFVCTWLYKSVFICTSLTFFSTSSWRGWDMLSPLFWFWIRKKRSSPFWN